MVPADKNRNLYKVEKENYKKYLRDNITKTYKKSTNSKINRGDLEVKRIADKLLISDRVYQLQKHGAYIMVKDHKESFPHLDLSHHQSQISVKLAKLFWTE